MVIPSSPFTAVALLFCGGFSGLGLTGWYKIATSQSGPSEPAAHCGDCQCERSSTAEPAALLEIVITNEKADGFCWGLAAGLLISFSVCCFIHFWVRSCRRADCERPDVGSRSSVTVTIGDHGETSSISSTPGRRRRGGGKLENASARTPDTGLV